MSGYAVGHVLRSSRASGTSLLVLIVIAEATHQDGTGAWPAVPSIAKLARTSERNVFRVIRELEEAGELQIERNAGPHGTNLYSIPGVGQLRLGDDMGVTPDKVSPLTAEAPGDDTRVTPPLTTATGRGDTAMSPEPSLPVHEPSKNLSRAARAAAIEIPTRLPTRKEIEREQHRFGKEAEQVWTAAARKAGSPYITRGHLRQVHELAIEATRVASEGQVLSAIRRRLEAKSAPVRIPEWARLEQADDEQREHQRRVAPALDEVIEDKGRVGGLRPLASGVARVTAALGATP